ncbi:unnamed protein product, partial [Timema podura]|nr:unnamed protein product [Timema podura]
NDLEAAREAYDAFLSHYPYCYGYWRKYADYEKRKGNKEKCEESELKEAVGLNITLFFPTASSPPDLPRLQLLLLKWQYLVNGLSVHTMKIHGII